MSTVMERLAKYDRALKMSTVEVDDYVREYVQNGIEVLKEKWGDDFVDHIDPLLLDLGSANRCVLGQLYDDAEPTEEQWVWLERELNTRRSEDGFMRGLAILDGEVALSPGEYGFDSLDSDVTYDHLTAAWLEALRAEVENASD